ncbi:hypothetical protein [Kribbella sp. NPDC051620]|uniref:hypothetical protein n=1 Tax=Kribbella sp. NPDC051620 TaxID=3364120 RepID=UPI00379F14DC
MRGFKTRLLGAGVVMLLATIGTATASADVAAGPPRPTDKQLRTIDPATTCLRGTARPWIDQVEPRLQAFLPGAETTNQYTVDFELFTLADSQVIWTGTSFPKNPGQTGLWTQALELPPQLQDATTYGWHARVSDGTTTSAWSRTCELTVDTVKPNSPGLTITPAEQPYKVGQTITLNFTNAGSADVTKYGFSVLSQEPNTFVPARTGTAKVKLTEAGPSYINAWSYDKAGNESFEPTNIRITVVS